MQKDYTGRRILAVLAHPDDETFGMGGTLAYYAHSGAEVYLVCTTRGEAGEVAPQYLEGYASIAELRAEELRCAAKTLGIKQHFFLDHRDSGMPGSAFNHDPHALMNIPLDQVADEVEAYLRTLQPHVVITHDPAGNYHHPDHIATHQAAVMAFTRLIQQAEAEQENAYRPEGLYFYSFHRRRMKWLLYLMPLLGMDPKRYGRNGDINLERILSMDFPLHVEVHYASVAALRDQASRCHASQGGTGREWTLFGRLRRLFTASKDAFMQAHPAPQNRRVKRDLFEGLSG